MVLIDTALNRNIFNTVIQPINLAKSVAARSFTNERAINTSIYEAENDERNFAFPIFNSPKNMPDLND